MILALLFLLLPSEVTVDTDSIFVGDLIAFSQSDPRATVSLGIAPAPGLARRVLKQEILLKLQAAGFSGADLDIPENTLVRRRSVGLDRDQVTRAVLDAFRRRFSSANVEITTVDIPSLQVGTGPVELTATLPPRFDPSTWVSVRLEVRGSNFIRNTYVRTSVRIETEQPVIKNSIAAHGSIQPEDVEIKLLPVRGAPAERFEGLLAKRDLQPGTPLTTDLLYTPVYVQKGDAVTVKASAGSITISATMRAKASGKFGETIQVEHLTGQGTTTARIIGPRTLEAVK